MRLQPLNRFGRWGVFQQPARPVKIIVALREDLLRLVLDQTRDAGFQEEKYESLFLRLRWKPAQLRELLDLRVSMLIREQYTTKRVTFNDIFQERLEERAHSTML